MVRTILVLLALLGAPILIGTGGHVLTLLLAVAGCLVLLLRPVSVHTRFLQPAPHGPSPAPPTMAAAAFDEAPPFPEPAQALPRTQPGPSMRNVGTLPVDARIAEPCAVLIAQICHELRTPLNAVIGFSTLMEREVFGPVGHPRYQEYVGHIVESGHSLLRSAEATLALTTLLSRPSGVTLVDCNLREVIGEAIGFLPTAVVLDTEALLADVPRELGVRADRHALVHALGHLFMHAAAPAGTNAAHLAIGIETMSGAVRITVRVPVACRHPVAAAGPLPLLIARAMIELQGASLDIDIAADGHHDWTAATTLEAAVDAMLI